MEFHFTTGDVVRIERQGHGQRFRVTVGERVHEVEVHRLTPSDILFSIDGERRHAHLAADGRGRHVAFDADVFTLARAEPQRRRRDAGAGDASLAASMHGQVVKVLVSEGDRVARGDTLVVLEAMKMEIRVTAPHEGRVSRLLCAPG
ncbi:MAG: biotin/lipoyl-binding protein, partial [Anaerolineae bacterium]|nr:biotin/lipoyl-binding protein [Anaerolineae bacterium]